MTIIHLKVLIHSKLIQNMRTWHESNHHSFFNMNNIMGLFKIIIIAGIILVVVIALSPLFKFLKDTDGCWNDAALHFLNNLLKMCEDNWSL